jgi:hypothetical protein
MRTNEERAAKALKILECHYEDDGDAIAALTDVLADLRHLAFLRELDYAAADQMAAQHYREEIDDAANLEDERSIG